MNPLTLVKRTQKITAREAELGISEDASWHAKYKQSAYVFVGGIPFDLTEGDLLAVFAQYGDIVDVNLIRDKGTGKSRGFAFVAYEDQRSTNLAVDNLNGASVLGRIIRVDHAANYKKKEEEDEEEAQKKREARGVCHAFQKGECNRGAACRFSHNEQRCANTGWGAKDSDSKWDHDMHNKLSKSYITSGNVSDSITDSPLREKVPRFRSDDKDKRMSRLEDNEGGSKRSPKRNDINAREHNRESMGKHSEMSERGHNFKDWDRRDEKRPEQDKTRSILEDRKWSTNERSISHRLEQNRTEDRRRREERSGRHDVESNPRKDQRRDERSGRYDMERNPQDDHGQRGGEKRSRHDRHSSAHHNKEGNEVHDRRSRK